MKYKQVDLSDFDMDHYYNSQNAVSKTLKKPIRELTSQLTKTNPNGVGNVLKDTYQ